MPSVKLQVPTKPHQIVCICVCLCVYINFKEKILDKIYVNI